MKALVQVFPTYNNLSNSELQSIDSYFWSRASVKKAIREAEQKKIDNCNQAIADLKGQGGDIKYEVDDIIW